jgi:hypothetical protein
MVELNTHIDEVLNYAAVYSTRYISERILVR